MQFRPCIDIHDGCVKQIVGGTLLDSGASENYVSDMSAADYARLYASQGLIGGHVILLNHPGQDMYEATKEQALEALKAYPGGLMVGGGINPDNAMEYIEAGASHVIVTSYVFYNGRIDYDRLAQMVGRVGRDHLVLDLSCRRRGDDYYVVTDRWQTFTEEKLSVELMEKLSDYADEFLIHAADVEGRVSGIEMEVIGILAGFKKRPVTYAGGIASFSDIEAIAEVGQGHIDITIGSALDIFGGKLRYEEVLDYIDNIG